MSWALSSSSCGSPAPQDRQHHLGQDARCGRHQVEPPDAADVRLQELEALVPARRPEVDGRVVAADHRVQLAHRRRPVAAEPRLLAGRQGQDRPHVRIGEVQLRETLERAVERERDGPHVGELVGQGGDRGGEDADRVLDLVAQVDEALGAGPAVDLPEQGAQLGLGDPVHRLLDARGEPCPGQARLLDRRQHGTQPSTPPRSGTIAGRMSADAAYLELLHRAREHTLLGSCATLLEWDEDVHMPEGGAEHRAEQQALRGPAPAPAGHRPAAGRSPRRGRGEAGASAWRRAIPPPSISASCARSTRRPG